VKFIHDDPEFPELLRIVGAQRAPALAAALVEKDYWVSHTLWSIQRSGLECWFKGGTSLSKGFGLIHRFSEDLDLKLAAGRTSEFADVANWRSDSPRHTRLRREFFRNLSDRLDVPGAVVELHPVDEHWRGAELRVLFPHKSGASLEAPMKPYVLIEAGNARVVPHVARDCGSFVHSALTQRGMERNYVDNLPRSVRCVHPLLTLIEKLDAVHRRFHRTELQARGFVRHYEDAARVILAERGLPALPSDLSDLVQVMLSNREIRELPRPDCDCVRPDFTERWREVGREFDATSSMYFGPRLSLAEACQTISSWLARTQRK
jgi:hypothetical protein